jgi:hypothetical protein
VVLDGVVAQLVEHHNGIVGVIGSNPFGSTILLFWNEGRPHQPESFSTALFWAAHSVERVRTNDVNSLGQLDEQFLP